MFSFHEVSHFYTTTWLALASQVTSIANRLGATDVSDQFESMFEILRYLARYPELSQAGDNCQLLLS
jgi:hypothetical protein